MRCRRVSGGCLHCWHLGMCDRHADNPTLSDQRRLVAAGLAPFYLDEDVLREPLAWKKPYLVPTQFMGDIGHEQVREEWIDRMFAVMCDAKRQMFLLLTKRPERLRALEQKRCGQRYRIGGWLKGNHRQYVPGVPYCGHYPLPNAALGVSVEDPQTADERIPLLLQTPAAYRWLSLEPLLGPVDLRAVRYIGGSVLFVGDEGGAEYAGSPSGLISWCVVGAESGPHRRPCRIEWVRSIVEQCKAAGVACFVKQIDIGGKVVKDPAKFPEDLRVRQFPKGWPV